MATTLRLDKERDEALRRQAEAEGRSMHAVVVDAIAEYLERHAHRARVEQAAGNVVARHASLLRRLGEA